MTRAAERAIEQLEQQLDETDDPAEREAIMRDLREIERDLADEERWREHGREQGWQ
jgi:hypothetical protein